MGKLFLEYIDTPKLYACKGCKTHLADSSEVISKDFYSGGNKAFLFNKVVNYYCGPVNDRNLRTGLHKVSDIFCKMCHCTLGWKYNWAQETDQKYKEGKVILERNQLEKEII